ncbi:MAG: transcriptional repressor LexA [Spirochaetaceae bacterium]|nr:transcriptional repressor LexA [Spirochaetaceae bacterium]
MKGLTERQHEILKFISCYTEENGWPPTIRECAKHFDVSVGAIQCHFAALQKKGYLFQSEKRSRSIRVLLDESQSAEKESICKIPLLGTVAAGKPLLSEENLDGYVSLSSSLVPATGQYFALKVRGTSMIDAGILDGDIAIVRQTNTASNGQIVVALLDDAVTLKRFFRETYRIKLQPENSEFRPIYCQDVNILGVLAGIVRKY